MKFTLPPALIFALNGISLCTLAVTGGFENRSSDGVCVVVHDPNVTSTFASGPSTSSPWSCCPAARTGVARLPARTDVTNRLRFMLHLARATWQLPCLG